MIALFLSCFSLFVQAQEKLSVRGPEPEVVSLGSQSVITLSLSGAGSNFSLGTLPKVEGLEFSAGRPSQSSFQSIVNGKVSSFSSTSWSIRITAQREGKFEIPPLTVIAGKETLSTKPLQLEVVRDLVGEKFAFLEVLVPRESYFVGEPIRVRWRFGFDARFVQNSMVQLFNTRLEIPTQLRLPWINDLPGTVLLEEESSNSSQRGKKQLSFAFNEMVEQATQLSDEERDGNSFLVLEVERSLLPVNSGELVFPEPLLRFAFASRFEEDFFAGRVAADRRDAFVYGKRLSLKILPLPEEGRPGGFTGAVGRFNVQAQVNPRELKVGESLKFSLRIEGEGNFGFFDPPRLEELDGFHVYGKIEEKGKGFRNVVYDLAPLREDLTALPSIAFSFFDTNSPPGYRTVHTQPIPIKVRALPEGEKLQPLADEASRRAIPGVSDIFDMKSVSVGTGTNTAIQLSPTLVVMVLFSPWVLALGLSFWVRARERERRDPQGLRARAAASEFCKAAQQTGMDLAELFAEYLAAKLRVAKAAVISPDLRSRLEVAGIPSELALRTTQVLENSLATRYGAKGSASDLQSFLALVEELETHFQKERRP